MDVFCSNSGSDDFHILDETPRQLPRGLGRYTCNHKEVIELVSFTSTANLNSIYNIKYESK